MVRSRRQTIYVPHQTSMILRKESDTEKLGTPALGPIAAKLNIDALLNFVLDSFLLSCILSPQITADRRRELTPAFSFLAPVSAFASPKQPKLCPLESITYELLYLIVFENSFWLKHFHTPHKMIGGWGGEPQNGPSPLPGHTPIAPFPCSIQARNSA